MTNLKTIIVDDELSAREILKHICSNHKEIEVAESFAHAIDAIKFLNKNHVDLVFLDIHMPDFNGFDFIETLPNPPMVVVVTSDAQVATDAFEYDCIVDFLVKPIKNERFVKTLQKLSARAKIKETPATSPKPVTNSTAQKEPDEIYVNINRRLIKIQLDDIDFVQAKGDYIKIATQEKDLIVHSTLKKMREKLPENRFLKIHRSYIINFDKIIDIEDNSVLIKREVIPVSRANRQLLMDRLNLL